MVCINPFPKRVANPNWDGNPLTKYDHVLVPCGKCLACRINKRREWTLRLLHEEIYSSSSYFVTLTYDDDHVPYDDNGNQCVCKSDVRLWFKRLRHKFGDGIRYFLNSEYGETFGRPHYHAILFNLPSTFAPDATIIKRPMGHRTSISFHSSSFEAIWGKGNVEFSDATAERCGYCAKYFVDRKEIDEILVPNFTLCSRGGRDGLGIGTQYSLDVADKVRAGNVNGVINPHTGKYVALPRIYRSHIFTVEEREQKFIEYMNQYEISPEYMAMLENRQLVEANQYKAMHFKNIKSKF